MRSRFPRSGASDRRGAGNTGQSSSTPSRCSDAVAGLPDIVGPAVDTPLGSPLASRRMPNLVASTTSPAAAVDRSADQFFVGERAVHVGGVEQGDPEIESALDGGERFGLVPLPVELAHAHAAEPLRGDDQSRARAASLHAVTVGGTRRAQQTSLTRRGADDHQGRQCLTCRSGPERTAGCASSWHGRRAPTSMLPASCWPAPGRCATTMISSSTTSRVRRKGRCGTRASPGARTPWRST